MYSINGGFLPEIELYATTTGYCNPIKCIKSFSSGSQCSHLNVLTNFPPVIEWMLNRLSSFFIEQILVQLVQKSTELFFNY